MKPSSLHLTQSAFGAVLRMQQAPETVSLPNTIDNLRVALNELLLREDHRFFKEYCNAGRLLAEEAQALIHTLGLRGVALSSLPSTETDLDSAMAALISYNAAIVDALASVSAPQATALVDRIIDWELSLYRKRTERVDAGVDLTASTSRLNAASFEKYLRNHHPEWPNVRVLSFRQQPGGYSKITILVDCEDNDGRHGMVLRVQPSRRMLDLDGMEIALEYPLLRFVHAAKLPVAKPLFLETDESHLGFQFMASRMMPGRVLGTYKGSDTVIDHNSLRDVVALMVQIATTPVAATDPLIQQSYLRRWVNYESLAENTRGTIEYWRDSGISANSPPSSLVNYGVNWLLTNVPSDESEPRLVHGDLGFHNILFDDGRISALLDWENSRFGDPAEELALFITASAGQASREQIMEWYRELGGPEVSDYRIRYFEVFHCVKVLIGGFVALQRVDDNPSNTLNFAVFGLQYLHYVGDALKGLVRAANAAKQA